MSVEQDSGRVIKLHVRLANGSFVETRVETELVTILELKQNLAERTTIPVERMRLLYESSILADDRTLESYNIRDGAVLRLIQLAASQNRDGQNDVNGISQANSQQRNPLSQIFDNQAFQAILSNPQYAQAMMMASPQMREAMENSPELRQMISDPEMMRQSLDAVRNPVLLRELQRNSDRALSNLEASPGGYSHIQRMYHSIQEPLSRTADENAMMPMDELNRRRARMLGVKKPSGDKINTSPLPNPWARPKPRQNQHRPSAQGQPNFIDNISRSVDLLSQLNISGDVNSRSATRAPRLPHESRSDLSYNPSGLSQLSGQLESMNFRSSSQNPVSGANSNVQSSSSSSQSQHNSDTSISNPDLEQPNDSNSDYNVHERMDSISTPQAESSVSEATAQASSSIFNNNEMQQLSEEDKYRLRERFHEQLKQLEEMGFPDGERNLRALTITNGDLGSALNYIVDDEDQ